MKRLKEAQLKHRLLKPSFLSVGLNQLIEKLKWSTLRTVSLIDHVLTNSKEKVRNYGIISNEILDHNFFYCTRKTKTVKTGKHNTISIRSHKKYSKESLLETLRKRIFETVPLLTVLTQHILT